MFEAVRLGLSYCRERCSQILYVGGCPVLFCRNGGAIMEEFGGWRPSYQSRGGHRSNPAAGCGIDPFVPGKRRTAGRSGEAHAEVEYIEGWKILGAFHPAGEKNQDQRLEAQYRANIQRHRVKVQLVNTKPYFGPGMVTLLRQIQVSAPVREASEKQRFHTAKHGRYDGGGGNRSETRVRGASRR